MTKFKDFINRTFCDEIISVEQPREWWEEYKDVGRRLEGYIIPVTYKYKGDRNLYCCIDNDHFMLSTKETALKDAMFIYDRLSRRIERRAIRRLNENTK